MKTVTSFLIRTLAISLMLLIMKLIGFKAISTESVILLAGFLTTFSRLDALTGQPAPVTP